MMNASKIKMTFDPEVAKELDTDSAIILSNIEFWVVKNASNDKHFHEGKYWTYNSIDSYKKLFDYLTENQIRYCLKKLTDAGYIETGNFSKNGFDRTTWYTVNTHLGKFTNASEKIPSSDLGKLPNRIGKTDTSYTDNKPYKNEDNKRAMIPDLNSEDPDAMAPVSDEVHFIMQNEKDIGSEFSSTESCFDYCKYAIRKHPEYWLSLKRSWGCNGVPARKIQNQVRAFSTWAVGNNLEKMEPKRFLTKMRVFFQGQNWGSTGKHVK